MKRSESLALLAENARYARQGWLLPNVPDHRAYDAARSHGEAAVHAVNVCRKATTAPPSIVGPFESRARAESRLAFRCALAAVGIKGAL